jgi:hypothetical protein
VLGGARWRLLALDRVRVVRDLTLHSDDPLYLRGHVQHRR